MLKSIIFLLKQTWRFKKAYVYTALILQVVTVAVPTISIIMPKYIIDELTNKQRIEYLTFFVIILILTNFIGNVLCDFLRGKLFVYQGVVFNKFQCMMAKKILDCDFERIEDPEFLNIREKASKFLYANGQGFGTVLTSAFNIIGKLFVFLSVVVIISSLSWIVVVIFIVLVLLSSIIDLKVRSNYTKWDMEKAPIERKTSYLLGIIENFAYGKDIRIYNARDFMLKRISKHLDISNKFYNNQIKVLNRSKYFNTLMSLFRDGISYVYLIYGVVTKIFGIGDFTMYLGAISQFSNAMNDLMQSLLDIRQFSGYYDALEKYVNIPSKMREGGTIRELDSKNYEIEFHNVAFKYPGQENFALKNVNIKISAGEKLAIVGENGAGKTTFVKLLTRLYDPTDGYITINNINIADIDYDLYQSLLSVVFQDFKLFSFSLKENIVFDDVVEDNCVVEVLKSVGLENKMNSLTKGIHTNIYRNFEEDGFEPSGGEGQRIAISRALYKDAAIIILDEPTAALDPRAEHDIYMNFNRLVDGKTAIYISHRMSSARFCDKIAVFKNGKIDEYGTHSELIATKGLYSELFNMQAKYYV